MPFGESVCMGEEGLGEDSAGACAVYKRRDFNSDVARRNGETKGGRHGARQRGDGGKSEGTENSRKYSAVEEEMKSWSVRSRIEGAPSFLYDHVSLTSNSAVAGPDPSEESAVVSVSSETRRMLLDMSISPLGAGGLLGVFDVPLAASGSGAGDDDADDAFETGLGGMIMASRYWIGSAEESGGDPVREMDPSAMKPSSKRRYRSAQSNRAAIPIIGKSYYSRHAPLGSVGTPRQPRHHPRLQLTFC